MGRYREAPAAGMSPLYESHLLSLQPQIPALTGQDLQTHQQFLTASQRGSQGHQAADPAHRQGAQQGWEIDDVSTRESHAQHDATFWAQPAVHSGV